jgi:WD40 repeat protein
MSGGTLAAVLSENVASASVPSSVLFSTIRAATLFAAGQAGAAGASAVTATALAEGVVRAMLLSKLKVVAGFVLAAGVVASMASLVGIGVLATEPHQPPATTRAAIPDGQPQTATKPIVVPEDGAVTHLAWSADGKVVAAVSVTSEPMELRDQEGKNPETHWFSISKIKLWDARTGKLKQALGAERKTDIHDIAFSPDRKTAAIAVSKWPEKMYSRYVQRAGDPPAPGKSREIRIVDAETWALKRTVTVDNGSLQALVFSPDGKTLAFGGSSVRVVGGAYVKLWDVPNEKLKGGTKFEPPSVLSRGDGGVWQLTFSPDGTVLAAGDARGRLRLFDARTGEVKQVWDPAHSGPVRGVAFCPGERLLVSVGDKAVKLWDVPTRTLWWTPEGNQGVFAALAFSPDGTLMATGGNVKEGDKYRAEVILWETSNWKPKQTLPDQTVFINTLAFSPDGKTLAIGSGRNQTTAKATGEIKLVPVE